MGVGSKNTGKKVRKKKKGIFIFALIIVILFLVVAGAGYYLYNFQIFKTLRLCVGEDVDSEIFCSDVQSCFDDMGNPEQEIIEGDYPKFIKKKFGELMTEIVLCDETCKIRNIRGIDLETGEISVELIESCEESEIEILIEIGGKEAVEVWQFLKKQ
jgi:hypothetical protein